MQWDFLIDETELELLLPREHRHYAQAVKRAIAHFLSKLTEERQRQILAHQARLGPQAALPERLKQLAHDCPVLHKLAQTIGRDQRLAPALREQLQPLESLPPSVPRSVFERALQAELGSLEVRGITLAEDALAEGSVAVVVPFVERRNKGRRHGVFKILKPGIEDRLHHELDLLPKVGAYLDECCQRLKIPELDYQAAFDHVREKLSWETRLDQEQLHLLVARKSYADDQTVVIPQLFEHSTPRVTAMERIVGTSVERRPFFAEVSRRQRAKHVGRVLASHPIFSADEQALFHADPHAGNMMVTPDGRLALLDWSLVGQLTEQDRTAIAQLLLAAITFDHQGFDHVLRRVAAQDNVDKSLLTRIVMRHMDKLRRGAQPGLTWLLDLLDQAVQTARLRVSANLLLFRKALLTLNGLVAELSASDKLLDEVLLVEFVRHFIAEFPKRFIFQVASQQSRTHVSNNDLVQLVLGLPSAVARWLLGGVGAPPLVSRQSSKFGVPAATGAP